MECVRNKSLLLCSILVVVFTQPSINSGQLANTLDYSQYFYPSSIHASKSYPYLFFQVGSNVHVRDGLTGDICQSIKLNDGETVKDCDMDSILAYGKEPDDGDNHYRRIDLNGNSEYCVLKDSKKLGINATPCGQIYFGGKPYLFYQTGNAINHDYKFIVEGSAGILWSVTNDEGETWFYNGYFSTKGKSIITIASVKNNTDIFSLKLYDLLTGKQVSALEGCFEKTSISQYPLPLIPLQTCAQNRELQLYDTNHNKIVYKKVVPNWFYTKPFNNAIWLTTVEDKSNQYRYGDSGPIRIIKIGLDGRELENLAITPTLPNLPVYSFEIASNQVGVLIAKHKSVIYNFRTNQKLLELDLDSPEVYFSNGKILFVTTSELVCVDDETFASTWKLNIARSGYIREFETDKNSYLINSVYDHKSQCDAVQIKIINKADNSLEPYEFFVSPFSGGEKNIYDSPYGLVFINDGNICSFAIGGIERFRIKDLGGIQSWKALDDPRYVEIKYHHNRTYRLDTKTGSFVFVNTKTQNK